MLRTGQQYIDSLRDGRVLYIGDERVDDIPGHPAFDKIAATYARLYDLKAAPENAERLSYEEDGGRHSMYWMRPRNQADLERRTSAHRFITEFSYGLLGRSPDATASNITGMAMKPEVLAEAEGGFPDHLMALWRRLRDEDLFLTYAIVPPPAARNPEFYQTQGIPSPTLKVTSEDADGVTLNGMKFLATSAAVANEVIVGNILPLAPDQKAESITCVIPFNLPGMTLWSRKPIARDSGPEFEAPLSWRFDESDCVLLFEDVHVPWDKIIVHNNTALSRDIFIRTASHVLSNHQSIVRLHSKLRFVSGVASLVTKATNANAIPAVRETLARIASFEATFGALVDGQIYSHEQFSDDFVLYARRYVYAGLLWSAEHHSEVLDTVRELMGGGVFQFPASIDILRDTELRRQFETYWATKDYASAERMKLFQLAWDLVGSPHSSRLQSYEKFFIGPVFSVLNYNFINAPWDELEGLAVDLMADYDVPDFGSDTQQD
jgi:4-hydroxyphenylacetate 3-monooxygenase